MSIIPTNKEDIEFIKELQTVKIDELDNNQIDELLEWTKDINWPQAQLIIKFLNPYIYQIDNKIFNILDGNDDVWKNSIITGLLLNSKTAPSSKIMSKLEDIHINPSVCEIEEETNIYAKMVLDKYNNS